MCQVLLMAPLTIPESRCCHTHIVNEDTEAQEESVTC